MKCSRQLVNCCCSIRDSRFVPRWLWPQVEALGKTSEKVDLALIGHGFRGVEKRKIAHAVNHYYPGLPILEMCFHSPEIPGADFILSDSPHELISAIGLVLEGRRVRGYTE